MKSPIFLPGVAHSLFFVSLAYEDKPFSKSNLRWSLSNHLQYLWKRRCENRACASVFPQLGAPAACEVPGDGVSLSPVPAGSAQGRVPDAVRGVAAEGDGDGKASAPLHLLHTVQVL